MRSIFPLAGASLVLLEIVEVAVHQTGLFLPLGGSHIAQIAIVFGLAFVVDEFVSVLR